MKRRRAWQEDLLSQVHTDTTTETLEANSGALANNFDAAAVQAELDVQTRVTQAFDTTRQEVKELINSQIDDLNRIIDNPNASDEDRIKAEVERSNYEQLGVLLDTVSGALYTPNANGLTGTIANSIAPALSYEIGQHFKDKEEQGSTAHILAHTIVAGLVAGAAGNDVLSAAISAGGSEALAPRLSEWLYDTEELSELDAGQKETISAILSLGSSAITVASGGSTTDIVASSTASSVAVENNRQLHSAEITWVNDNAQRFAEYYRERTGIELSDEEAERILAQGGASLVDESYNNELDAANNGNIQLAREFIGEDYTDLSVLEYSDPNSLTGVYRTRGFNPDSNEYVNRYANLEGFSENEDFYEHYLNLSDGNNEASWYDYGEGAVNPFTQAAYAFQNDPFGTIGAAGSGLMDFLSNPIDELGQVGMEIRGLVDRGNLDTFLNDDVSAARHYSEAGSIAGAALIPGAVGGIRAAGRSLDNVVDDALDINVRYVTGQGEVNDIQRQLNIENGRNFEQDQVATRIDEFGDGTADQVTLVPQNEIGNVPGNRTRVDGLTRTGVDSYGNPTYTIDEDKLSNFTNLTTGQNAALREVVQGSGQFEVRSRVKELDLYPGDIITVTNYVVNRSESLFEN